MGVDGPDDKRTYGRVNTGQKIRCTVLSVGSGDKFEPKDLTVKNISPGGISFEATKEVPMGTIVKLKLKLPLSTQDEPSLVSGRVIHCLKSGKAEKYTVGVAYIREKKID
ncbi:MAG: PilZ domain-containing protein [bacterium]